MSSIAYQSLVASLSSLGLDQEAAEYHGILCGMLCYRDDAPEDLGLAEQGRVLDIDSGPGGCLTDLRRESLQQLQEMNTEFSPLLPDDDEGLDERVEALALWCGGFIYGLATAPGFNLEGLSEDARELVSDFSELSRTALDATEAESDEDNERDYAELVEYVRVGAQLIFLELRQGQSRPAQAEDTVH